MLNKHYINIVKKTSGTARKSLGNLSDPKLDEKAICKLLKTIEITPASLR